MINIFCVRPTRFSIGNDAINLALRRLLKDAFDQPINLIQVPAIERDGQGWHSGLLARTIHEMNLYGHGVIVGGGNLYENGQLDVDVHALAELRPPLLLCSLSYGRIYDHRRDLRRRTDAMPDDVIIELHRAAFRSIARDEATYRHLHGLGLRDVVLGGCPTMSLGRMLPVENPKPEARNEVLISIRNPELMSVSLKDQARVRLEIERIIKAAHSQGFDGVRLLCHDKRDMTFAASLGDYDYILPDDVESYFQLLRRAALVVSFRLHAFLPCIAFGIPSINISYDERSLSLVRTLGLEEWDIDFVREPDVAAVVMDRMNHLAQLDAILQESRATWHALETAMHSSIRDFAAAAMSYSGALAYEG